MIKNLLTVLILILANGLPAIADDASAGASEEIDDSTKLWNRIDPLTERCRVATDSVQIEEMALELLALSDMPAGLSDDAEECVNKFLDREVIYSWYGGWQLLTDNDDEKLWSTTIRSFIDGQRKECLDLTKGGLQVPIAAIEKIDLTGNNEADTVVHVGRFRCDGSASMFSGSGGSPIALIIGDSVTEFFARGFAVSDPFASGYPVINLAVHGSFCGGYGVTNCVMATVWSDGNFQVVE